MSSFALAEMAQSPCALKQHDAGATHYLSYGHSEHRLGFSDSEHRLGFRAALTYTTRLIAQPPPGSLPSAGL